MDFSYQGDYPPIPFAASQADQGHLPAGYIGAQNEDYIMLPGIYAESASILAHESIGGGQPVEQALAVLHDVGRCNPYSVSARGWKELHTLCETVLALGLGAGEESAPTSQHTTSDLETPAAVCKWDGCVHAIASATQAAIKAHLQRYHFGPSSWNTTDRQRCRWDGCKSKISLKYESLPRHILTVHLGATVKRCEWCGETFSRSDAEKRHRNKGRCRNTSHATAPLHIDWRNPLMSEP